MKSPQAGSEVGGAVGIGVGGAGVAVGGCGVWVGTAVGSGAAGQQQASSRESRIALVSSVILSVFILVSLPH